MQFLILDEPTNHIDVYTMTGLERLLSSYDGTLLAVSHDRAFIENVADQVYVMPRGMPYTARLKNLILNFIFECPGSC